MLQQDQDVHGSVPDTPASSWHTHRGDPACAGTLTNRGSQYDWLRYGWDMLNDEGVPIEDFVDIYDDANPQNWDEDGSTVTTADDPIVRWEASADAHIPSWGAAHDNQKNNGQDH